MPTAQTRLEKLQVCKLLQCVRNGDKAQIAKLTESGVPNLINYNEPNEGETALIVAALANNEEMLAFLLSLGAHPDVFDLRGRTPIMRASEFGHIQVVDRLAQAGADMLLRDIEGKSVLFYCISPSKRHLACLRIAIKYGADVNNVANDTTPVFMFACETSLENEEMCLELLEKGADPSLKHEKSNRTCLMAACRSGSSKVVRKILEKCRDIIDQVQTQRPKWHAAHEAAAGGYLDCLQVLSAYGAKFDQYDDQGNNPIHIGALHGQAMCCKFLSQRGCNPKPKNTEGLQPKVIAKDQGHKEAAKECRKAEKSFGKTGKNNDPWALKLYDFVYENQKEVLETFQKYDVDNVKTVGREDFIEAMISMSAPLPDEADLKKLLQLHDPKGAEISYLVFIEGKKWVNKQYLMSAFEPKKKKKKGKKGGKKKGKFKNPMEVCVMPEGLRAVNGGPPLPAVPRHIHYTDIGRFDRDRPPHNPMHDDSAWYVARPDLTHLNIGDAAKNGDIDTLKDSLGKGTSVDTRDKFYKTPLMIAAAHGNIEVVKFLIENGADVNARDNFFWTPLHFACHAGILDVVQFLVESGADLECQTMNQSTPLMRAIESGRPEVVQYLFDQGARARVEFSSPDPKKDGYNLVEQWMYLWCDPRVREIVQPKIDSLPPATDKKKKGGGGGGGAKKDSAGDKNKPKSSHSQEKPTAMTSADDLSLLDQTLPHRHKGAILRAASALAGGIDNQEDISFVPIKIWTDQQTTGALIAQRVIRRQRYGWEVDFEDFKMPFPRNIARMVEEEGGFDD